MAEQQQGGLPALPPGLVPIPMLDINELSTLVANQVIERMHANGQQNPTNENRTRKPRCGHLQRVITKVMIEGLHVKKVDQIGSENQPGPLDLDEDDEAPWEIDFSKAPTHPENKEVVDRWVANVLASADLEALVANGKLNEAQCTEALVRSLLINSFDAARKAIKINQDATGRRLERVKASKDKSKRKQRQMDLCSNRWKASQGKIYEGKTIPRAFFKPSYHSDSEANPEPDLSTLERELNPERYVQLRNGATYEMLTPGWRSGEMTKLFHWLDGQHK
ncbi:hypothetical protein FRC07_014270, partial [Ceratobasidium sp. 392]